MPPFTTEDAVRLKLQFSDTAAVSSALVAQSIADAHVTVLRALAPDAPVEPPAEGLVLGETLLAGAHLCRSLAAHDAATQKRLTIGGQRIEEGKRFDTLSALADTFESQAWDALEPFIAPPRDHPPAQTTATVPVLGEE